VPTVIINAAARTWGSSSFPPPRSHEGGEALARAHAHSHPFGHAQPPRQPDRLRAQWITALVRAEVALMNGWLEWPLQTHRLGRMAVAGACTSSEHVPHARSTVPRASWLARAPAPASGSMRAMPAETRRSYVSAPIRCVFSTESHVSRLGTWGPPPKKKCVINLYIIYTNIYSI